MSKLCVFAAIAVAGAASSAMADLLYSQAPHTPGAAGGNGASTFEGGLPTPPPMYDREFVDDFTVPAGGWLVNRVGGSYIQFTPGDPNAVTGADIRFFQNNGGTVGAQVAAATVLNTTRTTGPGTYFARPEQLLDFDISQVALPAGNYFVQIQPIVNHNWFWLYSSPTTPIAGSSAQFQRGVLTTPGNDSTWPATWTPSGPNNTVFPVAFDLAFRIEGVVPAPGSLALLGLGGLLAARRRR